MRNVILAFLLGIILIPFAGFLYLHFGHLPVAVATRRFHSRSRSFVFRCNRASTRRCPETRQLK